MECDLEGGLKPESLFLGLPRVLLEGLFGEYASMPEYPPRIKP
jgi:hypothetical protein